MKPKPGSNVVHSVLSIASISLLLFTAGCATTNDATTADSLEPRWQHLRTGMSYTEVGSLLGPIDPDLKDALKEAQQEEREARKEYKETVKEMRAAGFTGQLPAMHSDISVDRGDYELKFRDGRLVTWAKQ